MATAWKSKIGPWSFIAGLIIAFLFAFFPSQNYWTVWVLGILGIVVGLLNITEKEVQSFLLAAVAFVVSATSLATIFQAFAFVKGFLDNVANLLGPAAAVVAIIALWKLAKD